MKAPQLTRRRALALAAMAGVLAGCGPASEESTQAQSAESADLADRLFETLRPATEVSELEAAIEEAGASGDQRLVSVLIEVVRAQDIGLLPGGPSAAISALSSLTGTPEQPWSDWVTWYATTDLEPPPGFRTWKGRIYSRIDEDFPSFFREDAPSRIRVEEIVWGGVALDGIPALVNPRMLPADEADYLTPTELVFGVEINGDARAYPLRILDWHEMANDVVGGVPVALAYCTLCGAGVLFDTRVGDATYEFGSSGFLMRSNKLMYDRQTFTLWNQLTGEPVLGKLADGSIELKRLPVVVSTWQAWHARHPDTQALSLETGHLRDYTPGNPYGGYFASLETMFPSEGAVDRLPDKARIFALYIDGQPHAYATADVVRDRVVNDQVGDTTVVVIAGGPDLKGVGIDRIRGPAVWDAGAEVRAYERKDHTFEPTEGTAQVRDAQGRLWQIREDALVGPDGQSLDRLGGHLAYWFGWVSFYPRTTLYGEQGSTGSS